MTPTTPSPISDQAAGEREAFEATGLDLCASPEGNFGVWKLACAWQREQLTVSVPVNSEWIEAAKAAEKVIDILWVSHHANRADDALEKLRAVLSTAPTTGSAPEYIATLPADWHVDSSLATWFPLTADELESTKRMFHDACHDLGLINEALGLDPDDGGAEPILDAIAELKAALLAVSMAGEKA